MQWPTVDNTISLTYAMRDGKGEFVSVKYTTAFLYPVQLYFLWGGMNRESQA